MKVVLFQAFFLAAVVLLLTSCAHSQDQPPVVSATPSPVSSSTRSPTPTITITPTPLPTSTPAPTPTPGGFDHPASIGDSMRVQIQTPGGLYDFTATLLEVATGKQARDLARSKISWPYYEEPIQGQQYLAARLRLEVSTVIDPDEVMVIYPYHHFTLRRSPDSQDVWSADFVEKWAEAYPPMEGTGWVFFLAREDVPYLLYFHPFLVVTETLGIREGGAFFGLLDS